RADVAAVHVGVGHQNDLVVAELRQVETTVVVDAAAQRRNQGRYFLRREHAIEPRALHVQDLALQRQNRLKMPIAPLLGAAAGAFAHDDVDFTDGGVFALTIGEYAGQRGHIEHALAHHLARFTGRLTRLGGEHRLLDDL